MVGGEPFEVIGWAPSSPPRAMQAAQSGSPLALPADAWGRRRPRRAGSAWRHPVAIVLMLHGVGAAMAPSELFVALPVSPLMLWAQVPKGIALVILGVAVWRGHPQSVRKCLAVALLAHAALRILGLFYSQWWSEAGPIDVSLALLYAASGVGLWQRRDWARWSCVILGATLLAVELFSLVRGFGYLIEGATMHWPEFLIGWLIAVAMMAVLPAALVSYGLLPSTRKHFQDVRGETTLS